MTRTNPKWVAGALLVSAAALSACDGTSSTSQTQSLAAFQKQANPICTAISEKISKIAAPSTFPAELDDFDKGSKAILAAIEKPYSDLADLTAPKEHEAEYARFAKALKFAVAEQKQVRKLVAEENGDTDALWLPQTNVATAQSKAMNEAELLGLDGCTTLTFKE